MGVLAFRRHRTATKPMQRRVLRPPFSDGIFVEAEEEGGAFAVAVAACVAVGLVHGIVEGVVGGGEGGGHSVGVVEGGGCGHRAVFFFGQGPVEAADAFGFGGACVEDGLGCGFDGGAAGVFGEGEIVVHDTCRVLVTAFQSACDGAHEGVVHGGA